VLYVKFVSVMKKRDSLALFLFVITSVLLIACGRKGSSLPDPVISVSIAPFRYFVEQIAGDDFSVNVMVPPGADPHIYEPYPQQMNNLRRSVAYISNGFLGFEMMWLERFYEANPVMRRLSLGEKIDPIESDHDHEGGHTEGADPHYWLSPRSALVIASSIRDLLAELNPDRAGQYELNYTKLLAGIEEVDRMATGLFADISDRAFMIFHPALGYLARDYALEEIALEHEGKEPSPARMKELIDRALSENIRVIFVQKEHDIRNARALASETGAEVVVIDPLSEDWHTAVTDIVSALHNSFAK